jgi:hypothetical protein
MPKYNVMINWTKTIEQSVEIEVSAKDEAAAEEKAQAKIDKAQAALMKSAKAMDEAFDWQENNNEDTFEYEVSEA